MSLPSAAATSRCSVDIDNRQSRLAVRESEASAMAETLVRVLEGEAATGHISVAIVDNACIHEVNRVHLQHDYPTDVVSFLLSEDGEPVDGDLMISAEMAISQAEGRVWGAMEELTLYAIHGTLHLLGYDDSNKADRTTMRRREAHYLGLLGWKELSHDRNPERESA